MKQKLIKTLLVSSIAALALQANATGFNKTSPQASGKVMQANQFYDVLANTKTEQVATKFGFPDEVLTLKTPAGELEGVVWVYKSAVQQANGLKDARFVFLKGEMKYVALSDAV